MTIDMLTKTILAGAALLLTTALGAAVPPEVVVETPNTQLLLTAQEGGDLRQSYYGDKSATLQQLRDAGSDLSFSALPAFGTVDAVHAPALAVQHTDGDLNLEMQVTDYERRDEGRATLHVFTLRDKLQPVTVRVFES